MKGAITYSIVFSPTPRSSSLGNCKLLLLFLTQVISLISDSVTNTQSLEMFDQRASRMSSNLTKIIF